MFLHLIVTVFIVVVSMSIMVCGDIKTKRSQELNNRVTYRVYGVLRVDKSPVYEREGMPRNQLQLEVNKVIVTKDVEKGKGNQKAEGKYIFVSWKRIKEQGIAGLVGKQVMIDGVIESACSSCLVLMNKDDQADLFFCVLNVEPVNFELIYGNDRCVQSIPGVELQDKYAK